MKGKTFMREGLMLNRFMVVGTLFVILSLEASSVLAFSHNDPNPGWGSQLFPDGTYGPDTSRGSQLFPDGTYGPDFGRGSQLFPDGTYGPR